MGRLSMSALTAFVGGAIVMGGASAHAAGFEKANMWGGKEVGTASIGAPTAAGANAIYFNPAGLVTKAGNSISLNVSPTFSQFKGPINNTNTEATSAQSTTFPFGVTYGHSEADFGYGAGVFVSAGSNVDFGDVDFATATGVKPAVKSSISVVEFSAGGAYKVNDDLKVGLAWRVAMAQADFAFANRMALGAGHNAVANIKLNDLKDTQYAAFRLGAQYKLSETMDLGFTYRSEINFAAKGTGTGQVSSFISTVGAANQTLPGGDTTAYTTLPMQIALGVVERSSEDWNFMAQYEWTQYSRVGELKVEGPMFTTSNNKTHLMTDWRDQHLLRLGAECKSASWPVRLGYAVATAVTNPDYARATYAAPGLGHALTVGTGKAMTLGEGENNFNVDGAFEYAFASADGGKAASGTTSAGSDARSGTYSASAYVIHLGATYTF